MTTETPSDVRARESRTVQSAAGGVKPASADSKARAEARIRQLRGNPDLQPGERDKYWAPNPPDGWTYEWKLKSVMGQDDVDRIRAIELAGWEPVPLSRHPELMPRGWKGETIEVGGLVLMERPSVFTQEAREEERRAAREAVLTKENQMREGRAGDLGKRSADIRKTREPMSVPE